MIPHVIHTLTKRRRASRGHAPGHEDSSLAIIWAESVAGKIWVLAEKRGHEDKDRTFPGHVRDRCN